VPTANLLGEGEGHGFFQLMGQLPQERLNIAVGGIAVIEQALKLTIRLTSRNAPPSARS
jgi:acyl-CoA dehydrogenase